MPRGHGRISSNAETVAARRNRSHIRRSLDECNHRSSLEERQISTLVLGNTEQRCFIFTLVSPELDNYCKLATFLQSLKVPDQRSHLTSAVIFEPPPAITFLVNLQKDPRPDLSESTCSPNSSLACNSSDMSIMHQSCNRNKRSKSLKDFTNNFAPTRCMTVDTSSGSPSDELVSDITKVEKPFKRSSKKKGKKKGKHHKRSSFKKDSNELDGHHESSSYSTVVETSMGISLACLGDQISDNNELDGHHESGSYSTVVETSMGISLACLGDQISDNLSDNASFSPNFVVEDITIDKDVSDNNLADSSPSMMSCMSFNDDMEEFEAVVSLSQEFTHEEYTDYSIGELKSTSSAESVPSTVSMNVKSASLKESIHNNDNSSSIYADACGDAVLGSFQDNRKSDVSKKCGKDVETRLSIIANGGGDMSNEVDSDFRKCNSSFERTIINSFAIDNGVSYDYDSSEPFVHAHSSTERIQCSSEASSSNDFQPVKSGKRGRAARKMAAHTRKDNSHTVWQKVEKMNTRRCINKVNNVYDVSSKVEPPSKASGARVRLNSSAGLDHNVRSSKHFCPSETNVKKKHIVSKQVNNYSRKGSPSGNMNLARPSKIHVQQKEGMQIVPPVNHDEHATTGFGSPCSQSTANHMKEAMLPINTCNMSGQMTSSAACNQIGPSLSTLDSSGQIHKIDVEGNADNNVFRGYEKTQNDLYLMNGTDQYRKAECSLAAYMGADNNSVHELRKWVPVGRNDATLSHIGNAENMINSVTNESNSYMLDNNISEADVSSDVQFYVPLTGTDTQSSSRSGDDADCSSSETDMLSDKLMSCSCTDGEVSVPEGPNLQLSHEVKDQQFSKFETDLEKIIHAVNNAYKLHTADGIHLISGSPLAEFERFMHSASPVISQRHHNRVCLVCSAEHHTSSCHCFHQLRNISLASLWQWYEEPGCFGLEVKAEDNHNFKRLHDGSVEFRAYFVPYLSAVQLFGRSHSTYASSNLEVAVSCDIDEATGSSSNIGSLPILSVLLPQPRKEANACFLESSSPAINQFSNQSVKDTHLSDEELIFEYFEHAQPPQRRPLFEKIKELVNGDRSSNSHMYGDPLKLECLSLRDLHPASWYAVAWYPIYRIPQGNFRAAFLTYHSLGHSIHQSASNMGVVITRLIFPVVGLQSYNAKKECWFQPRDTTFTGVQNEDSISSPVKIPQERLQTLEQTASVMATATVRKGDQRSVNNHPDYNHFFSRW